MKNTILKNRATKICLLVLVLGAMLSTIAFMGFRNNLTASASTQSTNYDLYTNNDYFQFNGNRHSIRYYPTLVQPQRGSVGVQGKINFVLNLGSADDVIAQIVPRYLFASPNEVLHIGDQYGFFISTTPMGNNSSNYKSTVIVFDISTKTDVTEQPLYTIGSEVEPIFQCRYAYLKAGSGLVSFEYKDTLQTMLGSTSSIKTKTLSYSNLSNDRIIAMPSKAEETRVASSEGGATLSSTVFYDNVSDFYLKDVSFTTSLSNVDKLNHGETLYDPYLDDGYFMSLVMCNFGGRYYVKNAPVLDKDVIYNNIYNTITFIAGFTPASPLIDVQDGIKLAGDWFGIANQSQTLSTKYIIDNRSFEIESFGGSREIQRANRLY